MRGCVCGWRVASLAGTVLGSQVQDRRKAVRLYGETHVLASFVATQSFFRTPDSGAWSSLCVPPAHAPPAPELYCTVVDNLEIGTPAFFKYSLASFPLDYFL